MFKENALDFKEYIDDYGKGHPGIIWWLKENMDGKIEYANAILNIYWMKKTKLACRNKNYPCHMSSNKVIGLYAVKLPFCKGSRIVEITFKDLATVVSCNNNSKEKYYFTTGQ